jgi:hypothetical protein
MRNAIDIWSLYPSFSAYGPENIGKPYWNGYMKTGKIKANPGFIPTLPAA